MVSIPLLVPDFITFASRRLPNIEGRMGGQNKTNWSLDEATVRKVNIGWLPVKVGTSARWRVQSPRDTDTFLHGDCSGCVLGVCLSGATRQIENKRYKKCMKVEGVPTFSSMPPPYPTLPILWAKQSLFHPMWNTSHLRRNHNTNYQHCQY